MIIDTKNYSEYCARLAYLLKTPGREIQARDYALILADDLMDSYVDTPEVSTIGFVKNLIDDKKADDYTYKYAIAVAHGVADILMDCIESNESGVYIDTDRPLSDISDTATGIVENMRRFSAEATAA